MIGLAAVSTAGVFALLAAPAHAFPATGGMEVSDGMAPPGGAEQTMTDPIPANATAGSVGVAPLSGDDLVAFRDLTAAIVEGFRGPRSCPVVLICEGAVGDGLWARLGR